MHWSNIPGFYALFFFSALDLTSHIHRRVLFLLWFCLFILSWAISPLFSSSIMDIDWPGELIFQCHIFFTFSYCSWGSQGKKTEGICHSLLQWTTFCQNSPLWPVHLGWPCTAWLIASLSYTRLWFMWSFSLVFCDCGFHSRGRGAVVLASSLCPLMHEDKRLVQASWWEALAVRKTDAFELWC